MLITTALGRPVPADDWNRIRGDTILKVLYDRYFNPFRTTGIAITSGETATTSSPFA